MSSKDGAPGMPERNTCPTCGSAVRIEGNTTKYYVPAPRELPGAREAERVSNPKDGSTICPHGEDPFSCPICFPRELPCAGEAASANQLLKPTNISSSDAREAAEEYGEAWKPDNAEAKDLPISRALALIGKESFLAGVEWALKALAKGGGGET